ncbi:MAG TPA: zinc ABC transporter substrate-binding protein, partial [Saprospiraceae bacterium]|nr:zinc ABC transporter substrate-binding protein [Saprospiraceae bacterium]
MVNRTVCIFFIWISVFGLTTAQKSELVATASIMQDIVSRVAGPDFPVESIVPLGGDPHIYNPTPSDAQLISQAELI